MMFKTVYYVCKGHKKIGEPYDTYDDACGFLKFLVMVRPFETKYNIKKCKKLVK